MEASKSATPEVPDTKAQDTEEGNVGEVTSELSPEDVQKLSDLAKIIEQAKEEARKESERRLQSAKDREVGKVYREKKAVEADLRATQAGQAYIVDLLTKNLEPAARDEFIRGMGAAVNRAREVATQLPPEEQVLVTEAQMLAVDLRRAGISCDMANPSVSDKRLDFTLPSTFIATAREVLGTVSSAPAAPAATKPAVIPPPVEEGTRHQPPSSVDKLRANYAMGLISTSEYMAQCAARHIAP